MRNSDRPADSAGSDSEQVQTAAARVDTRSAGSEPAPVIDQGIAVRTIVPWALFALALGAAGALYFAAYAPAATDRDRLQTALDELQRAHSKTESRLDDSQREVVVTRMRVEVLEKRLEVEENKRRAVQTALERLQLDLGEALDEEVQSGDVLVVTRGGKVVVDVADKLLFDTGEVGISVSGQRLLLEVAKTLNRLPDVAFQVGGHTDSARVKSPHLRQKYPTNWELSTARATNVVRFLQEKGGVPGERLVAAGHAEYRPIADNDDPAERAKNRRIEITLVPAPRALRSAKPAAR
jgi:chemotaxis protein MotB